MFRPLFVKEWPSASSISFWYSTPPGYFGFNSPSLLRHLQNGIQSFSRSQLALAVRLTYLISKKIKRVYLPFQELHPLY